MAKKVEEKIKKSSNPKGKNSGGAIAMDKKSLGANKAPRVETKSTAKTRRAAKAQVEAIEKATKLPRTGVSGKAIAKATAIALTAGAAVVTPAVVVYKKNEKFEISLQSQASGFEAYKLEVKAGSSVAMLKEKINSTIELEGRHLEGIYKDLQCTMPYDDSETFKENATVFLKFENNEYSVKLPAKNSIYEITKIYVEDVGEVESLDKVEYSKKVQFIVKLKDGKVGDEDIKDIYDKGGLILKINGEDIEAKYNANQEILFEFIQPAKNLTITHIENVKNLYTFENSDESGEKILPVTLYEVDEEGNIGEEVSDVIHGDKVFVKYTETDGKVMTSFTLNGKVVPEDGIMTITDEFNFDYQEVDSNGLTFEKSNGVYGVTSYDASSNKDKETGELRNTVEIPSQVHNLPVTGLKGSLFAHNASLQSVTLPSSLETIGDSVFADCSNLTSIELPETLKTIGNYAFSSCSSLKEINIPTNVKSIGTSAFMNCSNLSLISIDSLTIYKLLTSTQTITSNFPYAKEILINEDVYDSYGNSFLQNDNYFVRFKYKNEPYVSHVYVNGLVNTSLAYNCLTTYGNATYLGVDSNTTHTLLYMEDKTKTSISISSSCVAIAGQAFIGSNLTTITLPSNVKEVGDGIFSDCTSLTAVTLPTSGLTTIPNNAFKGCTLLNSVSLPSSVTSIGNNAFQGTGFTNITIPSKVTSIGTYAFDACANLASVSLSNNLATVGSYAFRGTALQSITIPSNVVTIGASAFLNCSKLTNVTINSAEVAKVAGTTSTAGGALLAKATLVTIPVGISASTNTVLSATANYGKLTGSTNTYYVAKSLTSFTLPSDVTTITASAFENSKLTSISIPSTVTSIGTKAFNGCTNLKTVSGLTNITSIGESAFADSGLEKISLPTSITKIANNTFKNCSNLSSIYLGSLTEIGDYAFYGTGAISASLKSSITKIGQYAFADSGYSADISLSASTFTIGNYAFYNTDIESVVIEDPYRNTINSSNSRKIGNSAFENCSKLSSIDLGECNVNFNNTQGWGYLKLASYGTNCFAGTAVTSIYIPYGLSISEGMFKNCENLEKIEYIQYMNNYLGYYIACGSISIGKSSFSGCVNLKTVLLPNSFSTGAMDMNEDDIDNVYMTNYSIGALAFENCTSLTSISITGACSSIASTSFKGCSNLASVNFGTIVEMGQSVSGNGCLLSGMNDECYQGDLTYLSLNYFKTKTLQVTDSAGIRSDCIEKLNIYPYEGNRYVYEFKWCDSAWLAQTLVNGGSLSRTTVSR